MRPVVPSRVPVVALLFWLGCAGPHAAVHVAQPAPQAVSTTVRMATFNIQRCGPTKAKQRAVMEQLAAVIRRYDLVAVQEVQDVAERVPTLLLGIINERGPRFEMVVSPRSGQQPDDRHSQEQYVYFYRPDRFSPTGGHGLFDDSQRDYFQREPHVARFRVVGSCASVVLINVHTRPRAAVSEIGAIEHVFAWAASRYPGERHFVALGDFNAGCGYASEGDLNALPLHGEEYDWVVPHSADTNLAKAQCPYDRIVVRSSAGNLLVEDWGVDRAFTDRRVSDHWPVWANFRFPSSGQCNR